MQTVINAPGATIHVSLSHVPGITLEGPRDIGVALPNLGHSWPAQGGHFMGTMPAQGDTLAYHIILPPIQADEQKQLAWGAQGEEIEGLSDCDGHANTKLLLGRKKEHLAADYCGNFKHAGFEDFYLPSSREAAMMRAIDPLQFEEGWHWTSTQRSAYGAVVQDFRDGNQHYYFKFYKFLVRPVRRVFIHSSI